MWPNIEASFFEDLESIIKKTGPIHLILFTGDLVERGTSEEYTQLYHKFIKPLKEKLKSLCGSEPIYFTLPAITTYSARRPNGLKPR